MSELAQDYLVLVFVACVGTLQVASAYANLRGLLFLPSRRLSGLVGLVVAVGAFVWFFASDERNLPDTAGGIAGAQQFGYFVAGCAAAVAATYLVGSMVNASRCWRPDPPADGFQALRHSTVLQVWVRNFDWVWRRWLSLMRRSISG